MSPTRFSNSGKQLNKQAKVSNSLPPDYANSLPTAISTTSTRRSRHSLCNIVFQLKCLRQFALWESELKLNNLLSKTYSLESSETQAAGVEEKLTPHKPPQSEEDIKGHYKKHPNSHIYGNGRPNTKPPGKSLTPAHVKKVERNGHIKKALAQHKDACVGNVENQTTSPRCVELRSSRRTTKQSPGCQRRREWVKLQWR